MRETSIIDNHQDNFIYRQKQQGTTPKNANAKKNKKVNEPDYKIFNGPDALKNIFNESFDHKLKKNVKLTEENED